MSKAMNFSCGPEAVSYTHLDVYKRQLTTLLLYRNGFYVGKYISLEAKIAKNKDLYYNALSLAQPGWHEGHEDAVPFIKYLLGTILSAYRDFEERFELVEIKLPALETVRRATRCV